MSIIEAYNKAWDEGDVGTLETIIHDDCVFNPHVGGMTMSKSDILGFVKSENTPTSENIEFCMRMMKSELLILSFTLQMTLTLKP